MVSYREKQALWPKIETAQELGSRLANVRGGGKWVNGYTADPPCHASSGHQSFHFADAPGGGILATCWACQTVGNKGWHNEVEQRLGCAIQFVMPDGELRYPKWAGLEPKERTRPSMEAVMQKFDELHTLQATPLPKGFTTEQIAELPCWYVLAAKGKMITNGQGKHEGKQLCYGWRHSRPEGVKLARYGGLVYIDDRDYWLNILPWDTRSNLIPAADTLGGHISFVLSGDLATPACHDVLVLDCDFKPDADEQGLGQEYRDNLKARLWAYGLAIFDSSSGNGFHAIARLQDLDVKRKPQGRYYPYPDPANPKRGLHGIAVDIFLPSSLRHVVINWDKMRTPASEALLCQPWAFYSALLPIPETG